MRALIALLVLVAGCSAASEARPEPGRRVAVTAPTTTIAPPPATAVRPTDEVGLRCQAVVDTRAAELAAVVPEGVDAVCREKSTDPLLEARGAGAYFGRGLVVIGYPRPGGPGWDEAVWRAAVAHELGHAYWFSRVNAADMARWREIRGASMVEPFIEDYADVFSAVIGGSMPPHLPYIGSPPPAEQVDTLCTERLLPC